MKALKALIISGIVVFVILVPAFVGLLTIGDWMTLNVPALIRDMGLTDILNSDALVPFCAAIIIFLFLSYVIYGDMVADEKQRQREITDRLWEAELAIDSLKSRILFHTEGHEMDSIDPGPIKHKECS